MPLAPAAIGIVLNHQKDKILLVRRQDTPVWVLPGGGVELDESPEEAVIREIFEETGFQVSIYSKCAEYYPINRLASFTSIYLCSVCQGKERLSSETSAIDFFPLQQLPKELFYLHREWIHEALNAKTFILKPLNQVTYRAVLKYFVANPLLVLRYLWTRYTKK